MENSLVLLLKKKWLDAILENNKTWEIRGRNTNIRGKIYLGRKDKIYGETFIVKSFNVDINELKRNSNLHRIENLSSIKYNTPFVWELENTKKYKNPIKFCRKKGQIVWCKL